MYAPTPFYTPKAQSAIASYGVVAPSPTVLDAFEVQSAIWAFYDFANTTMCPASGELR